MNGNRSHFMNGKTASPADADLMVIAERELGALIRALTELFGPEQARLAAEDWVDELELMDALPGPIRWAEATTVTDPQSRLARRLNTDVDRPTTRVASSVDDCPEAHLASIGRLISIGRV